MAWKKVPPALAELLAQHLARYPRAVSRPMFGCPAYFVAGNMFAGAFEERVFVRLDEAGRAELLAACDEATVFEPIKGRPMREYISLPESSLGGGELFETWLERSFQHVRALPPKQASAKQAPAKQAPAKQASAKQAPAKQAPAKQASAKQAPAKQAPAKQAPAKNAAAKKAKKPAAKKAKKPAAKQAKKPAAKQAKKPAAKQAKKPAAKKAPRR